MKVAIYMRVASSEQLEDTLTLQENCLRQVALDKGYEVTLAVKEQGSGLNYERTGLKKIEDNTGKYDAILAKDVSRIGRDAFKTSEWIRNMQSQNKQVIFASGEDPLGFEDQFIEYLLSKL